MTPKEAAEQLVPLMSDVNTIAWLETVIRTELVKTDGHTETHQYIVAVDPDSALQKQVDRIEAKLDRLLAAMGDSE